MPDKKGFRTHTALLALPWMLVILCLRLPAREWRTLSGASQTAERSERRISDLMLKSRVSALSVAVVQDDRIAFLFQAGRVDDSTKKAVDKQTVFRAASLSKPVFAYLALRLTDDGLLGLDTPVMRLLDKPLESYESYKAIGLSWALGWGRFYSPADEAFFHIGQEDGCENYAVVFPERRTGLVLFIVCGEGSGIAAAIARELIGDSYSPFAWMQY